MKLFQYSRAGKQGLGLIDGDQLRGVEGNVQHPLDIHTLLRSGADLTKVRAALATSPVINPEDIEFLPPVSAGAIICVGLNYVDHAAENAIAPPDFPVFFARFSSSLIGHGAPMILPSVSTQLDYEGELAVVIGKSGRHISRADALDHVAGYSAFNDGSVRDFQFRTHQWTLGKNFDATGAFGPSLVTADELPPGAKGLSLVTRLNGQVVQSASTSELIFDVACLIETLSTCMTLNPGDVLVTGTPAGVGLARKPPLFMKVGDVCEVEIEGVGGLRNAVQAEQSP